MLILDANILISFVLGKRVRYLVETYESRGIRFFTPDVALDDARKYLPALLERFAKFPVSAERGLDYALTLIDLASHDFYAGFESNARVRLKGRDEADWPVLASALAFACPIWTDDTDFFGIGTAVWTTNRVEIFLQEEVARFESEKEESR